MTRLAKFTVPFLAALMLAGITQTPSAHAADIAPVDADVASVDVESRWTYELTPYLYAPGIKGQVALFGSPNLSVDVKFKDVFDAIDWGNFPPVVMVYGEARNGRFGLFGDAIHMALEVDTTTPGPLFSGGRLNLELSAFTALGFYRLAEEDESHLDVLAGGRLWWLDGKVGLGAGVLPGITATEDDIWVDPVIGAKGQYALNDKFFVEGWGLIGGFGVSSDFMWDVYGGVGYEVNDWFSAAVGWRHIGVDYSNGSFLFDVDFDGPMFSGTFRF